MLQSALKLMTGVVWATAAVPASSRGRARRDRRRFTGCSSSRLRDIGPRRAPADARKGPPPGAGARLLYQVLAGIAGSAGSALLHGVELGYEIQELADG